MNKYVIAKTQIDSVELKCLVVSCGIRVGDAVYRHYKDKARLNANPLWCNCFLLSDGTVVQLTDTHRHLQYLSDVLGWDNLRMLQYMGDSPTPFSLRMKGGRAALFHGDAEVDAVSFPPPSGFYRQKTASGLPFCGSAMLQGLDWAAFQCLWPCDYAAAGRSCQFCFVGGNIENLAKKKKAPPRAVQPYDADGIVEYALKNDGISHVQITGGSSCDACAESEHINNYLMAVGWLRPTVPGEILLYITPPEDTGLIDGYFDSGASRIVCSVDVWDIDRAREITPGKIGAAGRARYLRALEYAARKHGGGKAVSNFVVGIEDFAALSEGAVWLAERGILPMPSVWIPIGRPVQGKIKAPGLDYYRRVKELFAVLYTKYKLEPPKSKGLNACVGRDIWRYAVNG
jgi:hypothetical protein